MFSVFIVIILLGSVLIIWVSCVFIRWWYDSYCVGLVKWFFIVSLFYCFIIFCMVVCVLCGCRFRELLMK